MKRGLQLNTKKKKKSEEGNDPKLVVNGAVVYGVYRNSKTLYIVQHCIVSPICTGYHIPGMLM